MQRLRSTEVSAVRPPKRPSGNAVSCLQYLRSTEVSAVSPPNDANGISASPVLITTSVSVSASIAARTSRHVSAVSASLLLASKRLPLVRFSSPNDRSRPRRTASRYRPRRSPPSLSTRTSAAAATTPCTVSSSRSAPSPMAARMLSLSVATEAAPSTHRKPIPLSSTSSGNAASSEALSCAPYCPSCSADRPSVMTTAS